MMDRLVKRPCLLIKICVVVTLATFDRWTATGQDRNASLMIWRSATPLTALTCAFLAHTFMRLQLRIAKGASGMFYRVYW
jgi:hypothetical protein